MIVGFVVIGGCFLYSNQQSSPSGEVEILGIENVTALDQNFYVNEPLSTKGAKIYLKLSGGRENFKVVDLEASNVANFSTRVVGNFTMTIYYEDFYIELPYKVTYKSIGLYNPDYRFDFELNEKIDKSEYKIKCCDFYGVTVATKTFSEVELEDFNTETITQSSEKLYRTATIKYGDLFTTFNYSVFYFSSDANYVGKSNLAVDGCLFEVTSFVPDFSGKLKIVKRIASNGLIESIFNYDLKRIDDKDYSTFFSKHIVAKFAYDTNKLILKKDAISASQDVEIQLYKAQSTVISDPSIVAIKQIKKLKDQFIVGENVSFDEVKLELELSDNSVVEVAVNKSNFTNLSTSTAGDFVAVVNYHKFTLQFEYSVAYKSLEFYPDPYVEGADLLEFKVDDYASLENLSLLCFDINGKRVACISVSSEFVRIENFDLSAENSVRRTAVVYCQGATLEFDYIVIR